MASKTLPDGRKVLVGSKADPDSSRYVPRTTTPTTNIQNTLGRVESRANELIALRDAPEPTEPTSDRYSRYTQSSGEEEVDVPSFEDIHSDMLSAAQGEINALKEYENTRLKEQSVINEKNDRSTSSVNTLTGLAGSSEANVQQDKTTAVGQRANDKIRAEAELHLQTLLGNVRSSAVTEARAQREDARLDEAARLKNRAARQEEAAAQLTNLAAGGVTFEGLKQGDPESFAYLASQFGGEEALKGAFVLNTPQDQILDKRIEGGKYVIAKQNPITGAVTVETVDLGLPPQFTKTVDAGNRILAIPDNWSGDPSELITIPKGLTPSQAQSSSGVPGDNPQLYAGLSSATATAVRSKVTKFSSEPIVQNFATIQEGYDFASSIEDTTQNPADDQALIYALAKALDPGSVVREGEYATAQKYAQSWINAYGKGVTQALAGTGFLSESARKNIKSVIGTKYDASKRSYTNLQNQYEQGINSLTGRGDGELFLVDYAAPISPGSNGVLRSPDGTQEVSVADLTPEEIKEAQAAGWQ